jgi:catalase
MAPAAIYSTFHNTNGKVFIYHRMHSCHRTSQEFHQVPVNWPRLKIQTWIRTLGFSSLSISPGKSKTHERLSQYIWIHEKICSKPKDRGCTQETLKRKEEENTFIRIKLTEPKELQIKKMVIKLKPTWNLRWGNQLQIINHKRNSWT